MSVSVGQAKLRLASKDLRVRWNETTLSWRDEVSRKFEEAHLKPLLLTLRTAEAALEEMHGVLNQVRRDCE